jgi:hypothetical protein
MTSSIFVRIALATAGAMLLSSVTWVGAQQNATVAIDRDDIGGVVTSAKGPEAGVWVIAETSDLPTHFVKIAVTDERGRYVVPDLPNATYQVWVRGYGLVDSAKQSAKPGQQLALRAQIAPNERAAAEVYPAAWWFAMIKPPAGAENQVRFERTLKECYDCHQLGNKYTREFAPYLSDAKTSLEAWDRRTRFGPSGPSMNGFYQQFGESQKLIADWTDRVKAGEAPKLAPPRPTGIERNVVVSLWDWGTPIDGRADLAAADTRNGRSNANGLVFGVSQMNDALNVLDPKTNTATIVKTPTSAPPMVSGFNASPTPSPVFGPDMWKRQGDPRSVAIDAKGRVWFTLRTRENGKQPSWCIGDAANKFGKYYPLTQSGKQVAVYHPTTQKFENVDTCFTVDHNQMSTENFVYYGMTGAVGWVDMDTWDKTHDSEKSTGWCPAVIDTNGDGKISTGWTEPNEPVDPARDHRITFGCYSVTVNPKDGTLWCSGIGSGDKRLVRLDKGPNPPETCKAEFFEPPTGQTPELIGTGGIEAAADGVVYQGWRVSGHFTGFDRTKCKSTKDLKADGKSCPEGWTIYRDNNEPTFTDSLYKSTEHYLTHLDTWDTLGLGADSPTYGSTNTDSMEVLSMKTKQWVTMRVPYPMGFFTRHANGRIDDPGAGWKGKGFWASYASYAAWHAEGGKGTLPKAVKFQIRPNPLAK